MPQHDWTTPLELKIGLFDLSASVETHKASVRVETADWSSVHCVILPTCFQFSVSCSKTGKGRNLHTNFLVTYQLSQQYLAENSQSCKAFPKLALPHKRSSAKFKFRSCVYADRRGKTRRPGLTASFVSSPPTRHWVEHTKGRARNCCPRPS